MSIGKTIKDARLAKGWTQQDLSVKSSVSVATIRAIEKSVRKGNRANLMAIGTALDLPNVVDLVVEARRRPLVSEQLAQGSSIGEPPPRKKSKRGWTATNASPLPSFDEIPHFDLSLAAGPWTDVVDVPEICDPEKVREGLFRVRLAGDSMMPNYKPGMIVEFRCLRPGMDQLVRGRDYYIQRDDGTATFKRLQAMNEEGLIFEALNLKKYPDPIIVSAAVIVRMARAIGIFREIEP